MVVESPESFKAVLDEQGIDSRVYYGQPCHRQGVYASHPQHNSTFPITDAIASHLVAIPIHHQLTENEVQRVIRAVTIATSVSDGVGK